MDDLAALYFVAVATAAALVGQHLVRKVIAILGRASVIIFILTLTLCVSAVLLGKRTSTALWTFFWYSLIL